MRVRTLQHNTPLSLAVVHDAPDPALWKHLGTAVRDQREMKNG
jgi:hypothetical protein